MTIPENAGESDLENDVEETVILTRRDRRRAGEQDAAPEDAVPADAASAEASVDVDEATVVVDRAKRAAAQGEAEQAEAEEIDEATRVVDRTAPDAGDEIDEATIVVDRTARTADDTVDESTVVVDRSRRAAEALVDEEADESTVVVDRSRGAETPEEKTVVVSRPARGLLRRRVAESDPIDDSIPEDTVPRGSISFERPAVATPSIYKPRPAPLSPTAPPVVHGAAAPTRVENPELVSVAKQGARWGRYTLLAFAGACVVSFAGLVGLGFLVFG